MWAMADRFSRKMFEGCLCIMLSLVAASVLSGQFKAQKMTADVHVGNSQDTNCKRACFQQSRFQVFLDCSSLQVFMA